MAPLVVEMTLAGCLVVVMGVVEDHPLAIARQDEHVAAVGLREESLVEHEIRRPLSDEPSVYESCLVKALRSADEVMSRGDDRLARFCLGLQDVHQVLLCPGIDTGNRLLKEVELGIGCDGT